jgi:cytochrome c
MKYQDVLLAAVLGSALMSNVFADEMMDLAKSKACLACHSIDKKIVGPAFKEVAAKYKGQAGAGAELAKKVQTGGKGTWGTVPMPPNKVTDDEALKLVTWVLSQS